MKNQNSNHYLKLTAPAKINFYLHIVGKKDDNYHLLDSLFGFADYGDTVLLKSAPEISLKIKGRFAGQLQDVAENIVLKAVKQMQEYASVKQNVAIVLNKNLPVASGIGGGSSDAAAVLKGLCHLWQLKPNPEDLKIRSLSLGADVWACFNGGSVQVSGIGEIVKPYPIPKVYGVLVNPMIAVATKMIFDHYHADFSQPMPLVKTNLTSLDFIQELQTRKNDLEAVAVKICPAIRTVIEAISATDKCLLARMSGSGATCFGLYANKRAALQANQQLIKQFPYWWIKAITLAD